MKHTPARRNDTANAPENMYAFLFSHGVTLPQTLAWYISAQNTAHWTAYESGRIVEWVTVRVDVGDGG